MPSTILTDHIHFVLVLHDMKVNVIVLKMSKPLLCWEVIYGHNCNDCHRNSSSKHKKIDELEVHH